MMHKRTKACSISKKTKLKVYERDMGTCIFCGAPGLPEAHVVPRSHGGLGVEQNIVTVCRICHDKMDNSVQRQQMLSKAAEYLKVFYPNWDTKNLIYDKWRKDKGIEQIDNKKSNNDMDSDGMTSKKTGKDKGEPPDGFYFL